jgi:hypothetical protein
MTPRCLCLLPSRWPRVVIVATLALLGAFSRPGFADPCISYPAISNFLTTYVNPTNGVGPSPEAPYAMTFFDAAGAREGTRVPVPGYGYTHGAPDPRLVLAIAGAESHFGTDHTCCSGTYNDWFVGGGCNADGTCAAFRYNNYTDAINAVALLIANYMSQGLVTIYDISTRYCGTGCGAAPPGCSLQNAWTCNVTRWYTGQQRSPNGLTLGSPGVQYYGCPSQQSLPCGAGLLYEVPNVYSNCCICDCSGNRAVEVPEIITGVNIALGSYGQPMCWAATLRAPDNWWPAIDNLLRGVDDALDGCQQ